MVESVLHLLKIHRKMIFGNSSVIVQDMFGKTPKSFDTVNMIFGSFVDHILQVIDLVMFTPTLQGIVAPKPVRIVDRTLSSFLPDDGHEIIRRDTLNHSCINPAITLQKPKNNAFSGRTSSTFTFAPATKVAFVQFNFTRELFTLQFRHMVDCLTQLLIDSRDRLVIEAEVVRKFVGWLRLVESFQNIEFPTQLCERLLFSTGLSAALHIPAPGLAYLKRTTENTFFASRKVGRAPENVLLPLYHMDILTPYGYYSP